MLRRTRLRPFGKRGKQWAEAKQAAEATLERRSNGRCEYCHKRFDRLDTHHAAGRPGSGLCLGPVADTADLLTRLCHDDPMTGNQGCHTLAHFDSLVRDSVRFAAAERLARTLDDDAAWSVYSDISLPIDDTLRELARMWDERQKA